MATLVPDNANITIGQMATAADESGLPSRTYRINWKTKRVEGYCDELEAMEQAVHNILLTDRFNYRIYSWEYGAETESLVGDGMAVALAEVERIVTEALLADARVLAVVDFTKEQTARDSLRVAFVVQTVFGAIPYERTVQVYA